MEHVLRDYLLTQMTSDASATLAAASPRDLVTAYATWKGRYIPTRPRRCKVSPELAASAKAHEHKASLDVIVKEIETGADLRPRLSKRVLVAHETPADPTASLARREDRDLMLADWGIHHLHLATAMGSDGFVERGADLLFAAFLPDDAYLIGIYGHLMDWARKEILEIVVRNWPASGLVLDTAAIGLPNEHSDEDRRVLRNHGISSPMVVVDGKVWASAALGHSVDGARTADRDGGRVGDRAMAGASGGPVRRGSPRGRRGCAPPCSRRLGAGGLRRVHRLAARGHLSLYRAPFLESLSRWPPHSYQRCEVRTRQSMAVERATI